MKNIFIVAYCLFFIVSQSFSQNYTWAATESAFEQSEGNAIAIDASGNLFVAESYTHTGIKSGVNIIKYNSSHTIIWQQKVEGKYLKKLSLCADLLGNIYLAGGYTDSISINNSFIAASNYGYNMFLLKFNSAGVFQIVKTSTGNDNCTAKKVSTDLQNNVYVGGIVNGTVNFDGTVITTPSLVYNFIAKYNSSGILQWIKHGYGNSFSGYGTGMATDVSDNTYLAGNFSGTVHFDSLTISSNAAFEIIYIAKISPSGQWLWVKKAGGETQEGFYGLALDNNGNPHITGFMGSTQAVFGTYTLTNGGGDDFFVAKYDPNGNVSWAINGGGPGVQWGMGICVDNQGTSYVARNSVYYSKFDSNGIYIGSENKAADNNAMVSDGQGGIYLTGAIGGPVPFGNYSLNISSGNQYQMYVARLNVASVTTSVKTNQKNDLLEIYPNPSDQYITISSKEPIKNCFLKITNSVGQTVYTENLKTGELKMDINISHLPKGLYVIELINVNSKDIIRARKLIIE